MKQQASHNHEDKLLEFAYGELPEAEARAVEAHVQGCDKCTGALDEIIGVRSKMSLLEPQGAPSDGLDSLLAYANQTARRIQAGPNPNRSKWRVWMFSLAGAASLVVVGIVANTAIKESPPVSAQVDQAFKDAEKKNAALSPATVDAARANELEHRKAIASKAEEAVPKPPLEFQGGKGIDSLSTGGSTGKSGLKGGLKGGLNDGMNDFGQAAGEGTTAGSLGELSRRGAGTGSGSTADDYDYTQGARLDSGRTSRSKLQSKDQAGYQTKQAPPAATGGDTTTPAVGGAPAGAVASPEPAPSLRDEKSDKAYDTRNYVEAKKPAPASPPPPPATKTASLSKERSEAPSKLSLSPKKKAAAVDREADLPVEDAAPDDEFVPAAETEQAPASEPVAAGPAQAQATPARPSSVVTAMPQVNAAQPRTMTDDQYSDLAEKAGRRGDHLNEANFLKLAVEVTRVASKQIGYLSRLCQAEIAIGNYQPASCDRLLKEHPTTGAAKMAEKALEAQRARRQSAPASADVKQ